MSDSTPTTSSNTGPRHALTAVEKQRVQVERLLKDPSKAAYVPPPPKEKVIRPAREMMKNVQGSSAGAGSGEFHVYKASRRREYERLKMMDDQARKETLTSEFERKRKEAEEVSEAKTAKNRAKRQKKKERAKMKGAKSEEVDDASAVDPEVVELPWKKRRLVNGKELVFRKPGEESDEDQDQVEGLQPNDTQQESSQEFLDRAPPLPISEETKITIHEDD